MRSQNEDDGAVPLSLILLFAHVPESILSNQHEHVFAWCERSATLMDPLRYHNLERYSLFWFPVEISIAYMSSKFWGFVLD